MRRRVLLGGTVALAGAALTHTAEAQEKKREAKAPEVAGNWTGTWGPYAPPGGETKPNAYPQAQMRLDCKVEQLSEGKWQATFEGECGRPYKYTIKMLGRQAGNVALFSGTADLGEKDGGVYDWIGRASDKEFVGFFTSRGYTGHFRLARPKETA